MQREPSREGRPRVLHFITRLGLGGAESVALSIARGLASEFDSGLYAIRGVAADEVGLAMARDCTAAGLPVFTGSRLPLKAGGLVAAGVHAARVMRSFAPEIVHLHTEIPEAAYAVMAAISHHGRGAALVRTIHNSVYWHFWPRLGRWCERRMRASHVACVSRDARSAFDRHRAAAGAGPLPAPPIIIHNGVPAPAGRRSSTREGPVRILFAGRFEPEKGTDLLPEIVAKVRAPASGCELVIHGQGRHGPALQALAGSPPPGWSIRVAPPTAQLRERMAEFDLLLMPSRFEGLGLVAVEALRAGLVVVGTDAPGLREALPPSYPWRARAGDPGSFASELQRALDAVESWPEAVALGCAFALEQFDLASMLRSYAALYRRAGAV